MPWFWAAEGAVNRFVWGPVMLAVLVGVGVYFTWRTGFLQLRKLGYMFKVTLGSLFQKKKGGTGQNLSPFAAMTTALAGTMGVGNIAGIATALTLGGPGAIFWMWLSALFGMMTKYAEVVLAVHYRETSPDGTHRGGPMYSIKKGLGRGWGWLSGVFCLLCVCASFGMGDMTQSNTIAQSLRQSFSIPYWATGVGVMVLCALVVLGGLKRIGAFTEKFVPLMSIFYIAASLWVIAVPRDQVGPAFGLIFRSAFGVRAAAGGVVGYTLQAALRTGVARGVFTNEAGLGSAPIAHAAAETDSPVKQGFWGMFEVFADTFVTCTLTTLVILTTGMWDSGLDGAALTTAAFDTVLGRWGSGFIAISVLFFAVSSMLGWCFYGESAMAYLSRGRQGPVFWYRVVFLVLIMVGATVELRPVWQLSDTLNGLMAVPNLLALLLLSPQVFRLTKEHFATAQKGAKGRRKTGPRRR